MAAPGPRTATAEPAAGVSRTATNFLSVTDIASFVGLRQCGRYLRLSAAHRALRRYDDTFNALGEDELDEALAAAGRNLEDEVATELQQHAPGALHLIPTRAERGRAPPATPWQEFLGLLSQPRAAANSNLGCWAAEVELKGLPTADSVVSLSGRADFILLLWHRGAPVLRIVECKASTEPQTKFIVQLVLYRMLLLRLLAEASDGQGRVCIAGCKWSVPSGHATGSAWAADGGSEGSGTLQVECLLRTKVSGAAGNAADGAPLPLAEVESMTRQLSAMLEPGDRISTALDSTIALQVVPYELDSHCASCGRAPECWVDSAVRGAVQLSGCGASEAQRLVAAGVRDIEDLATPPDEAPAVAPVAAGHTAATVAGAVAASSRPWRGLQVQDKVAVAGMSLPELQRLSLTAAVRARRWLERPRESVAQQPRPAFQLLPGAPPSCLPSDVAVRVYMSVTVDVVLRRVVGLAAHVAAPAVGSSDSRPGATRRAPADAPHQAAQAGWDMALLLEGVAMDSGSSSGAVLSTDADLDELEARLLAQFSDQLCVAVEQCAEQAPQQQGQGPLLHFYFHSHQEVRELIRRCGALDGHPTRGLSSGADLGWLPHLFGLRAEIGDLKGQGEPIAPLEQVMVSVMEDEVRRYATVWQGAGRLAATSVSWGGDGALYDWRRATAATTGAAAAAAAAFPGGGGNDGGGDMWAVFSAGGYLDSLVPFGAQLSRLLDKVARINRLSSECVAGAHPTDPQSRRQRPPLATANAAPGDIERAGSPDGDVTSLPTAVSVHHAEYVQVRPDISGDSIPPCFFRALWKQAARGLPLQQQQQGEQQGRSVGPNQDETRDVFQRGATRLRALLLTEAHAVRWLEERLVRLPGGGNPLLHKASLPLPLPLRSSLRTFRLDLAHLPGGPRQPPRGPQAARAGELARAALDAVWLNRGSEVREFWRKLGARPPAARAEDDRSCTIVLDRLQRMNEGKVYWLRGRVVAPTGCGNWTALAAATGLQERDSVVVTAVSDPWVCQDPLAARVRYGYGVIRLAAAAANTHAGDVNSRFGQPVSPPHPAASGGELWLDCCLDPIRYPDNGLFVKGTEGVWPWKVATGEAWVVLDAAPNISAWVASSAVESLQRFGGDSAYLAERLWMPPLPPPTPPPPLGGAGVCQDQVVPGEGQKEQKPQGTNESGPVVEPQTPVAVKARPGAGFEGPGGGNGSTSADHSTPASVMGAQGLFSPVESPSFPLSPSPETTGASSRAGSTRAAAVGDAARSGRQHLLLPGLDEDQAAAVVAFLEHPDSGSRVLLQGPPGTGKTEAMVAAVLAWLEQRVCHGGPMGPAGQGGVVLLSGPTHAAIDNLLGRVAMRLRDGGAPGGVDLRERVELVRVDAARKALDPELQKLGVLSKLPTTRAWKQGVWYVVGGTLRHLVKAANDLRIQTALIADPTGADLMERSGRGAFAAALVLDEASMVFAPHLMALCCLLVARGSLLVGGDHRQLAQITSHDFDAELRPNLVRFCPHLSAYDYVRQLAEGEAWERRQHRGTEPRHGDDQPAWTGGLPPPVSVCKLSYTHRLPSVLVSLIQPLYHQDGITLRGRPPAARTPPASTAAVFRSRANSSPVATCTPAARGGGAATPATAQAAGITATVVTPAVPYSSLAAGAAPGADGDGVWRQLWQGQGATGTEEGEGLFLAIHNEAGSSRVNALEVRLVEALLEALMETRRGRWDRGVQRPAGAGPASGSNGGAVVASGNSSGGGGCPASVALITPHRAQRRALIALVEGRGWGRDCRVDTVEKMQGGEAETVIFCATASDAATLERSEEFYSSVSRANVAFSRARRRLIVVASRAFLTHLPTSYHRYEGLALWRQLRSMCEARGTHLGEVFVTVSDSQRTQPPDMSIAAAVEAAPAAAAAASAAGGAAGGSAEAVPGSGVPAAAAEGVDPPAGVGTQGQGDGVTYRCDLFEGAAW